MTEAIERARAKATPTAVRLQIGVDDLDRFITNPQHEASASGVVLCPAFGGERPVLQGVFNLLVDVETPNRKAMYYRLFFTDQNNNPLTLLGFKDVRGDGGEDVWTATTTLFTRILRGHVGVEADGGATVLAGESSAFTCSIFLSS